MLADLAMIHQDKKAELIAAAEASVIYWIKDRPQPHANGLLFLAADGCEKARDLARETMRDVREAMGLHYG